MGKGRPVKTGLDYFQFDINLLQDRKFRKLRRKYSYLAQMVYITILCLAYGDKGYYIDYSDDVKDDVIEDILEFLSGPYQPTYETIESIIPELAASELIDRESLDRRIITSRRLQRNYYIATAERKTVNIDWNIWLLNEKEMRDLGSSNKILENYLNRPINTNNRPNNYVNLPINTQSKEEESKEEESKEEESKEEARKRAGALAPSYPAYFDNSEIQGRFIEYLELRKQLKCKNTDLAIKLLINKLNKVDDNTKLDSINEAIMGSWKTVYPKPNRQKRNEKPETEEDRERASQIDEFEQAATDWIYGTEDNNENSNEK